MYRPNGGAALDGAVSLLTTVDCGSAASTRIVSGGLSCFHQRLRVDSKGRIVAAAWSSGEQLIAATVMYHAMTRMTSL